MVFLSSKQTKKCQKKLLDPEESLMSHSVDAVCFIGNMRLICVQISRHTATLFCLTLVPQCLNQKRPYHSDLWICGLVYFYPFCHCKHTNVITLSYGFERRLFFCCFFFFNNDRMKGCRQLRVRYCVSPHHHHFMYSELPAWCYEHIAFACCCLSVKSPSVNIF